MVMLIKKKVFGINPCHADPRYALALQTVDPNQLDLNLHCLQFSF